MRYVDKFGAQVYAAFLFRSAASRRQARVPIIVGDLNRPETLPYDAFDCFLCTETFSFIYDVRAAVLGAYQVLKTRGILLGTVPGYCAQLSRYDADRWGDYWRFSSATVRRLLRDSFGHGPTIEKSWQRGAGTGLHSRLEDMPDRSLLAARGEMMYAILVGFRIVK